MSEAQTSYFPSANTSSQIRGATGSSALDFGFVGTLATPEDGSLRANETVASTNQRATCTGYYSGDNGTFGPYVTVDLEDNSTADDGFSCFVDAMGQRWKRTINGRVNIQWAGGKAGTSLTDTTYATVTGVAFDALTTYFTANGKGVYYVPATSGIFVTDRTIAPPSNTNIVNDGYLASQRDGGFRMIAPTKVSNVTVTGSGIYDGNAHVTGNRVEGSSPIWFQFCEDIWLTNTTVRNATTFAVSAEYCRRIHFTGNLVYNRTGSVDGGEPDTVSGDNQDGIHLSSCSDAIIDSNYVYSVDDSIAYTFSDLGGDAADSESAYYKYGSYGTDTYSNIVITNNVVHPDKAENVATGTAGVDPGTDSKVLGRGVRLSDNGTVPSDYLLKGVTVSNNHFIGGLCGVLVGTTSGSLNIVVEDISVSHNKFDRIASFYASDGDADNIYSRINRSTNAGVFISQARNVEVIDNKLSDLGVAGIYARSGENILIENNRIRDLVINEAVGSPTGHHYAGIDLTPNVDTLSGVIVRGNTIDTVDGAGIHLQDNNGGTFLSNVDIIDNKIVDPNQETDIYGPIAYVNVNLDTVSEMGTIIEGFTPSGSYVDISESTVNSRVISPIKTLAWTTTVYNSGNGTRAFDLVDNSSSLTASVEVTATGVNANLKLVGKPEDGIKTINLPTSVEGKACDLLVEYRANSPASLIISDNSDNDPIILPSTSYWNTANITMGFSTDTPQNVNFTIFHDTATPIASVGSFANDSSTNPFATMTSIAGGVNLVKTDTDKVNWVGIPITAGSSGDILLVEFDYTINSGQGGPSITLRNGGTDSTIASVSQKFAFKANQTGSKQIIIVATGTYDTLVINSASSGNAHDFDVTNLAVGEITTDGTVRIGRLELTERP